MRKLGLLTLCTLIFGLLFYTLVQTTPTSSPAKSTANVSNPLPADNPNSSSSAPQLSLRMDRSLGQVPEQSTKRSPPALSDPASQTLSPYLNRGTAKQFALLAAALMLGLLVSRMILPASTNDVVSHPDLREPDLERTTDRNLEDLEQAHTQLREAQRLLDSGTTTHADELIAVNDLLESREVELNEARDRLTMLEQSMAELREELTLEQRRYDALSSTQQEQLERYEHEKHDTLQSYSSEIDEYEGEVEALRTQVNQTQHELESKDSLLTEVQNSFEAAVASKDELELYLHDSRSELAEKTQLVGDLEVTKDSLSERVAELQEQATLAANRKEELEQLGHSFEELVTARDALVEQYDTLNLNFTEAHNRALEADGLEEEALKLREEVERITTSKDEYVAELGEMHNLFGQAQSRAADADDLEDQVTQVVTDLEKVAAARDTAEQQVATLTASLNTVTEKFKLTDSQLDETEQRAAMSQDELESLREELERRNEVLEETLELLDSKQEALLVLQQNFDTLSREEQELRDEHKGLNQQSKRFEIENETLTESVNLLREDLSSMVQKIGEKNVVIEEQQEQLVDEQRKVNAQQAEIEALLSSVEAEHEKLNLLHVELEEARATELRLQDWDNSLQTYLNDIVNKNKLIDHLRDCVSDSATQSTALQEHSSELEEKLATYEALQSELVTIRDEFAAAGETLEQQQRLVEQLSELGKEREVALVEQTESLNEIQTERQQWLDQLTLTTNTAGELEAELIDQHDTFLSIEELIDGALSKRGVEPGVSASFEIPANDDYPSQPDSVLVRKTHALVDILEKADLSNRELATLQESLESQIEESNSNISELESIRLGQSNEFDGQRKDLQERLDAAANEHQGLLAELEEIREARDLLVTKSQAQEAKTEQLAQEHQVQLEATREEQQAHVEHLESQHQTELESTEKERNASVEQLELEHRSQFEKISDEHSMVLDKQQQEMQKQLDTAANDQQELLAELEEVQQQHEMTSTMSADQASQIGKLTNNLEEANEQLNSHADQFAQYRNTLAIAEQKVAEAEQVWADTDTALQASETALKQKEHELNELRALLATVEKISENDRVTLEKTEKELESERYDSDKALTAAREESKSMATLRDKAIKELTQQQQSYAELERSLTVALHEQRQDNAQLRLELAAQNERATHSSAVPVLTQKIKDGSRPAKIPVLEQPLAGGVTTDQTQIPVLKTPFDPGTS